MNGSNSINFEGFNVQKQFQQLQQKMKNIEDQMLQMNNRLKNISENIDSGGGTWGEGDIEINGSFYAKRGLKIDVSKSILLNGLWEDRHIGSVDWNKILNKPDFANLNETFTEIFNRLQQLENGIQNHTHNLQDLQGVLPVSKGGTGTDVYNPEDTVIYYDSRQRRLRQSGLSIRFLLGEDNQLPGTLAKRGRWGELYQTKYITANLYPSSDFEVTSKRYVDSLLEGLILKEPVRAQTTGPLNSVNMGDELIIEYNDQEFVVDGVPLYLNDRVLLKDQENKQENGIYVVYDFPESGKVVLRRQSDQDDSSSIKNGMYVWVNEGEINQNTQWVLVGAENVIVGETELTFIKFHGQSSGRPIQQGDGLILEQQNGYDIIKVGDGMITDIKIQSVDWSKITNKPQYDAQINQMLDQINELTSRLQNVENQVSQIQSSIFGLNNRIQNVESQVLAFQSQLLSIQDQLQNLEQDVNTRLFDLESQVQNLNISIQNMNISILQIRNDVQSLTNTISSLNTRINQLESNLNSVRNDLNNLSATVENNYNTLSDRINQLEQLIQTLQQDIQQLEIVNNRLEELENTLEEHFGDFNRLQSRVTTLEVNLIQLQNNYSQLNSQIQQLEQYIGSINNQIEDIQAQITNINQTIQSMQFDMSNFNTRITTIEGIVSSLQQSVTTLSATVTNLQTTVNNLSTTVQNMSQTIQTLEGTVQILGSRVNNLERDFMLINNAIEDMDYRIYVLELQFNNFREHTHDWEDISLSLELPASFLRGSVNQIQNTLVKRDQDANIYQNKLIITSSTLGADKREQVSIEFLNNAINNINIRAPVRVQTTQNLQQVYDPQSETLTMSSYGQLIIDGVQVNTNDRILVKDQTDSARNGIYVVLTPGSSNSQQILKRAQDFNQSSANNIKNGILIWVSDGTTNKNSLWVLSTLNPIVLDQTQLSFVPIENLLRLDFNQYVRRDEVSDVPAPAKILRMDSQGMLPQIAYAQQRLSNRVQINITGQVIGSAEFDGSSDITINVQNTREYVQCDYNLSIKEQTQIRGTIPPEPKDKRIIVMPEQQCIYYDDGNQLHLVQTQMVQPPFPKLQQQVKVQIDPNTGNFSIVRSYQIQSVTKIQVGIYEIVCNYTPLDTVQFQSQIAHYTSLQTSYTQQYTQISPTRFRLYIFPRTSEPLGFDFLVFAQAQEKNNLYW